MKRHLETRFRVNEDTCLIRNFFRFFRRRRSLRRDRKEAAVIWCIWKDLSTWSLFIWKDFHEMSSASNEDERRPYTFNCEFFCHKGRGKIASLSLGRKRLTASLGFEWRCINSWQLFGGDWQSIAKRLRIIRTRMTSQCECTWDECPETSHSHTCRLFGAILHQWLKNSSAVERQRLLCAVKKRSC